MNVTPGGNESLCAAAGIDPEDCVTVPGKHT
jgi:hypothetical protein